MPVCPKCKNINIVREEEGYLWCRSCGWTSDGGGLPHGKDKIRVGAD